MNFSRLLPTLLACLIAACQTTRTTPPPNAVSANATVRAELERLYALNNQAFLNRDLAGIMALRAPDFHTVSNDNVTRDRAAMQNYIEGLLNGVRKWNQVSITIDSLEVRNDTAYAITSQYVDRMALRPDNQVHHVQTWVTQREIWVRNNGQWRMWRVDNLRNQRRLVDGQPG